MNITGNVRFQSTEEIIEKAVINLLRRMHYDAFTIKDICAEAGINRSTFYAHYSDINDLMLKIENKLAKRIQEIFNPANTYNQDLFIMFFDFIKENKIFYKAFVKSNTPSFVAPDMLKMQKTVLKQLSSGNNYNYSDSEINYHLHFFGGGLKAICAEWLLNGCKESSEEMAKIIFNEYANNAKYFQ